jgi:hypothetical protein
MKTIFKSFLAIAILLLSMPLALNAQGEKAVIKKYLSFLPQLQSVKTPQKYLMTAVYINGDIFGNFTDKTKMTGEYTCGLPGDSAVWNNVKLSASNSKEADFTEAKKLNYMENFRYLPSPAMVAEKTAFRDFPATPENIFARNLIWDMYSFDVFAWKFYDSLRLNEPYVIDKPEKFDMAEIGNYTHSRMVFTWVGMTSLRNELCNVIEFTTLDNKLELAMDQIKTKGTEQYWGTVFVSARARRIEKGVMYSGTVQQIEVKGMKDSFLMRTVRELEVNRIQ